MDLFLLEQSHMRANLGLLVVCAGSLVARRSAGAAPGDGSVQFVQADTGLRGGDQVLSFPTGAGLTMHDASGVNLDVRGTFRATTDSTLVLDPTGGHAKLYSWEASRPWE